MLPIVRLLLIIVTLAVVVFGSMFALSELVEPQQRDIVVNVPTQIFNR